MKQWGRVGVVGVMYSFLGPQTNIIASHLPYPAIGQLTKVALEMLFAKSQFLESRVKAENESVSKSANKCHNSSLLIYNRYFPQPYIIYSHTTTSCFYLIKYNPNTNESSPTPPPQKGHLKSHYSLFILKDKGLWVIKCLLHQVWMCFLQVW